MDDGGVVRCGVLTKFNGWDATHACRQACIMSMTGGQWPPKEAGAWGALCPLAGPGQEGRVAAGREALAMALAQAWARACTPCTHARGRAKRAFSRLEQQRQAQPVPPIKAWRGGAGPLGGLC